MLKNFFWLLILAEVAWVAGHAWRKPVVAPALPPAAAPAGPVGEPGANPASAMPAAGFGVAAGSQTRLWDEIREQLSSGDEAGRELVLNNLLLPLVESDPAAAGRLAETLDPDAGRAEVLRLVAQTWAGKNPAGALAWAAQLPDADERQAALANIVFQLAQADPAKAVAVAEQYHLNEGANDALPSLAAPWASRDLNAALGWAQNLPAGAQRDEIMARMAFVESQNAPVAAGSRVLTEIAPGAVQDEAVMTVLHQWSLKDMSGALSWAQAFPEGSLKDRALAELVVVNGRHN